MELLTALSSLTGRTNSIARDRRSIRIANPDLAVRLAAAGFVINCTGLMLGAGLPGGAGGTAARIQLISRTRTNKNADLSDRASSALGRRPTDLCATALFSFQGTDASARSDSDRITDRTKGARRQSQRSIDYHRASTVSTLSQAICPRLYAQSARRLPHEQPAACCFSPSLRRGRRRRPQRPCAKSTFPARTAAGSRNRPPSSPSRSC